MFSRKPNAIRQLFAQALFGANEGFAMMAGLRDDVCMFGGRLSRMAARFACYPFPSNWPGPSWIGSSFSALPLARARALWRLVAVSVNDGIFQFNSTQVALESADRTTITRGSSKCGKLWSFLPFSAPRWPVAWAQARRQPVQALALLAARRLARSPITTLLNPLWSVASLAQSLAKTALAADRALTRGFDHSWAGRGMSPAGLFYCYAPARASGGREPCSRRS